MLMRILEFTDKNAFRLNAVSATGLKSALKRVAEIINKKHTSVYNSPTLDIIECVVNSSGGDVRSAVLNLHFACLKGNTEITQVIAFRALFKL